MDKQFPLSSGCLNEDVPGCSPGKQKKQRNFPVDFFTSYENSLFHKQNLHSKLLCTCLHLDEMQKIGLGVTFLVLKSCKRTMTTAV